MIRGTSHDQDSRFKDKAQKMLSQSNWPDKYNIKIDLSKVDFDVLKEWIQKRTTQLLGYQDDIVSGTVISLLQQSVGKQQKPNAKKIHVAMSGFLTTHTLTFISQLWDWLDQAQKSKSGISKKLLDEKKQEELRRKEKLKQVNDKKNKIKNYKFDVIKKHVGRQKEPSVQAKRKQRYQNEQNNSHEGDRKRKNKGRSQSRDNKKRRKKSYQSESDQNDRRKNDRSRRQHSEKKRKYKRSYSRSQSSDRKSRSRSRQRTKRAITKKISSSSNSSSQQKRNRNQQKRQKRDNEHRHRKRSISKSESSQVVSSSNNQS